MDERHAKDIEDIANTVHHIERKQYEQDARIGKMEGRVEAQDALMTEKYLRLDQKIDGVAAEVTKIGNGIKDVGQALKDHTEQEDQDRRIMIREQRKTFLTLIGIILSGVLSVVGFLVQRGLSA